MKKHVIAALMGFAAASLPAAASAANFSFTGTFTTDNQYQGFEFDVGSTSTVTIQGFGYDGGVNAAGQTIAAGGFDTVFSLYDSTGFNIANNDDGSGPDSFLSLSLGAGKYRVYVAQYDNFGPQTLGLPWAFDGQPNFAGGFYDQFRGSQRNGNYALDILNVQGAGAVPESATWALMLVGFGAAGVALRSRRRVAVSFV